MSRGKRFTSEQKEQLKALIEQGLSDKEIMEQFPCGVNTIWRMRKLKPTKRAYVKAQAIAQVSASIRYCPCCGLDLKKVQIG